MSDLISREAVQRLLTNGECYTVDELVAAIAALPTVQPAVHPAFDCRQWWNYVVPMPLTSDDQGPATVGVDAAKLHYEVWDQDFVTHGSFDFLPDAINYAMALNYELPAVQPAPVTVQEVLSNPLKDRGKMIKPLPGAPAGGYPLTPNPVDVSQGRETDSKPSVDLTPEAVERLACEAELFGYNRQAATFRALSERLAEAQSDLNAERAVRVIMKAELATAIRDVWAYCEELEGEAYAKLPTVATEHEKGFWAAQKMTAKRIRRATTMPATLIPKEKPHE